MAEEMMTDAECQEFLADVVRIAKTRGVATGLVSFAPERPESGAIWVRCPPAVDGAGAGEVVSPLLQRVN